MSAHQFDHILQEVGNEVGFSLQVDENQACLVVLKSGLTVQLEMDEEGNLLLLSELGQVPPGRYREDLFFKSLVANHLGVRRGVLSFCPEIDQLMLHLRLPQSQLNGRYVVKEAEKFVSKARVWREAIAQGELPDLGENTPNST